MTTRQAKKVSLEIWRYLAKHPEIDTKDNLPDILYNKVKELRSLCPLCELFQRAGAICPRCPLKRCDEGSDYELWYHARSPEERALYAPKIVKAIKSWVIE